jgi:hypothetical protein
VSAHRDAVPRAIIEFLFRGWPWPLAWRRYQPTDDTGNGNPEQEQHTQVSKELPEL